MLVRDIRKVIVAFFFGGLLGVGLIHPGPVNANALQYTLQDLEGKAQSLSQYAGRWVIVNFWATWCGPCIQEIPELMAFAASYSDEVYVVGIALRKRQSMRSVHLSGNLGSVIPC